MFSAQSVCGGSDFLVHSDNFCGSKFDPFPFFDVCFLTPIKRTGYRCIPFFTQFHNSHCISAATLLLAASPLSSPTSFLAPIKLFDESWSLVPSTDVLPFLIASHMEFRLISNSQKVPSLFSSFCPKIQSNSSLSFSPSIPDPR